jgi:hypothetical protein
MYAALTALSALSAFSDLVQKPPGSALTALFPFRESAVSAVRIGTYHSESYLQGAL